MSHALRRVFIISLALAACIGAQSPETRRVARAGFDLYYRVYGTGAPIAILSGGPGMDCDYMGPVAREIAKTNRAVIIELRGTGRSMPPVLNPQTINVDEYVSDLEAVRADLRTERWTLLGHSAGAMLAMSYGARCPEHVVSLVLVGSGPVRRVSGNVMNDNVNLRLTPEERKQIPLLAKGGWPTAALVRLTTPGLFYDREKARAFLAGFRDESFHEETHRLLNLAQHAESDMRPSLKSFNRPALVIAGRQDPIDPGVQYEIHLALKNSQLEFLNRCGHFAWVEQPDEFYRIVKAFLAAHE